jgi:hypothetical protein
MKYSQAFWGSCLAGLMLMGCASAPPEVRKVHSKESEIFESIKKSHLALVDAYMAQKVQAFETFYFSEYGPAYVRNWKEIFKAGSGRNYEESRDFNLLHADLIAEYMETIAPLDSIRLELREAVTSEYAQAFAAHAEVDTWLASMEKLNASKKEALNKILGAAKPGLSLSSVENLVEKMKEKASSKVSEFQR